MFFILASSIIFVFTASASPVLDLDFPDPCVVVENGLYHVYATNGNGKNIQYATSANLKQWSVQGDALPKLGSWVSSPGLTWAPYVFKTDKGYTMYYTAHDRKTNWQCIGIATASTLNGTFVDTRSEPLICPADSNYGAIDPYMFVENGRYIVYSSTKYLKTGIYIQSTNQQGDNVTSAPTKLIEVSLDWENGVNEAPTLVKHGSKYVLFYSGASTFDADKYKTSYATSDNILGPYVKAAEPLITTPLTNGDALGPGGEDVITGTDGKDYIFFHGWDKAYKKRMLFVNHLEWQNDTPVFGTPV